MDVGSRRSRWTIVGTVIVALALSLAVASAAARRDAGNRYQGTVLRPAKKAADFALHDQNGRLVRLSAQRGKIVFVTFLYTHCHDVCPLIASNLNDAVRSLGGRHSGVTVDAISVDPKGDTPAAVRNFVRERRLLPQFHYLTGSKAALERVWHAYHIAVDPTKLDEVDHSAYELLVDRRGKTKLLYESSAKPADFVHDVRLLERGH